MDSQSLTDLIYDEDTFNEIVNNICQSKEVFLHVLNNLVSQNIMRNSCIFIKTLSENLFFRNMFEFIVLIFQEIVCPYLVPKLRVLRCFTDNLEVCELYFYGFSKVGLNLNETIMSSILKNLNFLANEAYKNANSKAFLKQYLDFLDTVCYYYQHFSEDKALFARCQSFSDLMRKEFNLHISEEERDIKLKSIETRVWDISYEDLQKNGRLSAVDVVSQSFVRNDNYRGMQNVGNSK